MVELTFIILYAIKNKGKRSKCSKLAKTYKMR